VKVAWRLYGSDAVSHLRKAKLGVAGIGELGRVGWLKHRSQRPNGLRFSGERPSEARERGRWKRVLGGLAIVHV
jgi:hypothetical protein